MNITTPCMFMLFCVHITFLKPSNSKKLWTPAMYDKKHPQWIVYQNHSGLFNYFLFNSTSANFDANDFIGRRKVEKKYFLYQIIYFF